TGTVTYSVYSDSACTTLVAGGKAQSFTEGVVPPSSAVTLRTAGTYRWTASYSGDANNLGSASMCGAETVTVTAAPTTLSTSLSGGGASGAAITVPAGTAVTDSATLAGAVASGATGQVTYNVYSDAKCTQLVHGGSPQSITTPGTLPSSAPVTLSAAGTHFWAPPPSRAPNQPKSVPPLPPGTGR